MHCDKAVINKGSDENMWNLYVLWHVLPTMSGFVDFGNFVSLKRLYNSAGMILGSLRKVSIRVINSLLMWRSSLMCQESVDAASSRSWKWKRLLTVDDLMQL